MTSSFPLSVARLPLTVRYPLTVIRDQWLRPALRNLGEGGAKGKCMVNGKGLKVNGATGRSVL